MGRTHQIGRSTEKGEAFFSSPNDRTQHDGDGHGFAGARRRRQQQLRLPPPLTLRGLTGLRCGRRPRLRPQPPPICNRISLRSLLPNPPCPVSWMSTRILRCVVSCGPFFVHAKVRRVCEMCRMAKEAKDEMVARAFPVMGKLFQRCAAAPTQAVASTGVLLLVSRLFLSLALSPCRDVILNILMDKGLDI